MVMTVAVLVKLTKVQATGVLSVAEILTGCSRWLVYVLFLIADLRCRDVPMILFTELDL